MSKPLILAPGQIWQRNQENHLQIIKIKEDIIYLLPVNLPTSAQYVVSTIQALLTEPRWKFIK